MEKELFACEDYLKDGLLYYVKFIIEVQVLKGQIYKEDLHKSIYDVIGKMKDEYQANYILQVFKNTTAEGNSISFGYQAKDVGMGMVEAIKVENNKFRMEYAEFRSDALGLPNITNIVLPYLCLLEAMLLSQEAGPLKLSVQNQVAATMKAGFHYRTSPFTVQHDATITYYAYDKTALDSQIDKEYLVYNALRRFYQQFRSEVLCSLPYLHLTKEAFELGHSLLWK